MRKWTGDSVKKSHGKTGSLDWRDGLAPKGRNSIHELYNTLLSQNQYENESVPEAW
jgi:hypothetical protein